MRPSAEELKVASTLSSLPPSGRASSERTAEVADVDGLASRYSALEREVRDFGGHPAARPLRHLER